MWEVEMTRTGLSLWAEATLGFDAAQLDDEPLVIDGNPTTGNFHLTEEDCAFPVFQIVRDYAPDAKAIGGRKHTAAVIGEGSIGLKIAAHGADTTATLAAMHELMVCTSQFEYTLGFKVNGVLFGTYVAKAELPLWGALDSGMIRADLNEATIAIPLNPPVSV